MLLSDNKPFIPSQGRAKDIPSEDKPSAGQGHKRKCSPKKNDLQRKFSSGLKNKRVFKQFFHANSKKKVFKIFFQAIYKISTIQKMVLSSSRGQGNFRRLEASRPKPRTWPSRPRTSKYVLEDSTSDNNSSRRDKTGKFINRPSYKYFWKFCRNGRWITSLRWFHTYAVMTYSIAQTTC